MMNEQVTELIFVLDRSGSMAGLENDTIGGFNSLVKKQRELPGKTNVTAVLFDDAYEVLWEGLDADKAVLTEKEYYVRGMTALLDAVGKTILGVSQRLATTAEDKRPRKVLFVITTDGYENASMEFTYEKVKEMINYQQEKHEWEFLFIGANIDAAKEASHIGVSEKDAIQFEASPCGVQKMYASVHEELAVRRK
ncbi:vWA domain-containing protein [Pradoshia sp.]